MEHWNLSSNAGRRPRQRWQVGLGAVGLFDEVSYLLCFDCRWQLGLTGLLGWCLVLGRHDRYRGPCPSG